ncbi:MAG: hypothetical protein HC809_12390, partial [Gammaproteobacteria bacterium]|nr:hypothetical protein [Gammaproteobacteria bacterium]
ELEGSKVFCKNLLHTANVPTASYQTFRRADDATRYIKDRYPESHDSVPVVVKADGLASGKGVIVCDTQRDALDAIDRIGSKREFGEAGNHIVIEERLFGQEASVLAITDGTTILTLPAAQDHKPAYDGDKGPNTGGMGAYCPTPLVDDAMIAKIESDILVPVVHAMKRARRPFKGVLYAGLMITDNGPELIALLDSDPRIAAYVFGHIHHAAQFEGARCPLLSAPSTCFQFAQGGTRFGVTADAPGCRVLDLYDDGTFTASVVRADVESHVDLSQFR